MAIKTIYRRGQYFELTGPDAEKPSSVILGDGGVIAVGEGSTYYAVDTMIPYVFGVDGWVVDLRHAGNQGVLVPVREHSIAITIVNPAAAQTDTITINGVACSFTSDATPTKQEVSDGLIAAIRASAQAENVLVSQGAGPGYEVIITPAHWIDPVITVSANLTDTVTAATAPIGVARRQWVFTTAPESSGWASIKGFPQGSIMFTFSATGTIEIRGMNGAQPDAANDGVLLDTITETEAWYTWSRPVDWIKLLVTANTGTINAELTAGREG